LLGRAALGAVSSLLVLGPLGALSVAAAAGPPITSASAAACGSPAGAGAGAAPSGTGTAASAAGPSPHLRLVSQTSWVAPGQPFLLDLAVAPAGSAAGRAPAGLEVEVEVFDSLHSRSAFDYTLCDRIGTDLVQTFGPVPLASLAPDPASPGAVGFPIAVASLHHPAPAHAPPFVLDLTGCGSSCAGVYPVRVLLETSGGEHVVDRFVTHLVFTDPAPGTRKLDLAWAIPVAAPPSLSSSGQPVLSRSAASPLATVSGALARHPGVPLTLVPSPVTMAGLAASHRPGAQAVLAALASWAGQPGHQVAAQPYAPVSVAALSSAGLSGQLGPQLARGQATLAATLGVRPSTGTWLTQEGLTSSALHLLEGRPDQPVQHLVLPEPDLSPLSGQSLTPTRPFALTATGGPGPTTIEATTADGGLAAHLAGGPRPVLAAHQLLADLAVVYFDEPYAPRPRGVVLDTPASWRPDAAFLAAALDGLASSPIVQPVTVDQLFAQVPAQVEAAGLTQVRTLATHPPATPSLPAAALRAAQRQLAAFQSVPAAGHEPAAAVSGMQDLLLVAQSAGITGTDRSVLLRDLKEAVHRQLATVHVQTDTVTLTSQKAQLPITVTSRAAYPVRGVLLVHSDKLTFLSTRSQPVTLTQRGQTAARPVTLTQRGLTVDFRVRTRATGEFPVSVSLVSPRGQLVIATGSVAVRSSAVSAVAIGLTVAAGIVLLGWWGHTLRKGRRNRNRRLVPAGPAAAPPAQP
ncbi:MAG: DUF6049 family protein, partial [Acidimicrobiales bacterium]